jgi:hypothetical protein
MFPARRPGMPCYRPKMGPFRVALVIVAACSGSSGKRTVDVNADSLIVVQEGDVVTAPVEVSPGTSQAVDFVVELPDGLPPDFATITTPGEIEIKPGCSLVEHGQSQALVSFVVRTNPDGLAASTTVSVEIQGRDDGPCAPALAAWLAADCSVPPTAMAQRIAVPLDAQQLCLRATAKDPAEMLDVELATAAPADRIAIDFASLGAQNALHPSSITVPVALTVQNLRGLFDIDYQIQRSGIADPQSGSITLEIGQPGDVAIDVMQALPALTEFGVSHATFRVFEYATSELPGPLCVRATRTTSQPMNEPDSKPFLRVSAGGDSKPPGELLCAQGPYDLAVSPHVDSAASEQVTIEVVREPDETTAVATSQQSASVTSVAEVFGCSYIPTDPPDINAYFAPEIVCADINGTLAVVTSFIGNDGSCLVTGTAGRFTAQPTPTHKDHLLALQLATGPETMILGLADAGPSAGVVEKLDPQTALWGPAPAAFTRPTPLPLDQAAPIAQLVGGPATHVAYPVAGSTWQIVIRCVTCQNPTEISYDTGLSGGTLQLTRTGDSISGALDSGGNTHMYSFAVAWSPDPVIVGQCHVGTIPGSPPHTAGTDAIGVAIGEGGAAAVVGWQQNTSLGCPSIPIGAPPPPATLGPAYGVATPGNNVLVGTSSGSWEAQFTSGVVTGWTQRDPVVADQTFGSTTQPDLPAYGLAMTTCVGAQPSFVTRTSSPQGSARFIWTGATVQVDPL